MSTHYDAAACMRYDSAFPVLDKSQTPNGSEQLGLTKREYFAAIALQGCIGSDTRDTVCASEHAQFAVRCADALIQALTAPVKP